MGENPIHPWKYEEYHRSLSHHTTHNDESIENMRATGDEDWSHYTQRNGGYPYWLLCMHNARSEEESSYEHNLNAPCMNRESRIAKAVLEEMKEHDGAHQRIPERITAEQMYIERETLVQTHFMNFFFLLEFLY